MEKKGPIPKQKAGKIKKQAISNEELLSGIRNGDKALLARSITLVESTKLAHLEKAEELISNCLKNKTDSIRIGITGVPGVGKSTFIEVFGSYLTKTGKKVAVLAVDPSSSYTKGSILGDKTRMETLAKDPNAFIRPSPASDSLGGVTRKTRETIVLCEAAGYDVILVETVGVGQSETAVHSMVDFFLLLKLAGAGDELQGIKRGIMEMADAIVINKADGNNLKNVNLAQTEFNRALHLYPSKENEWTPKVLSCSALENKGIAEIWSMIETFTHLTRKNSHFFKNRAKQNKNWFLQTVDSLLHHKFYQNSTTKVQLQKLLVKIEKNEISPFTAAKRLVNGTKQ
ncbi:methylmalonyl Co-A mutase-associated GTPase MeaB [Croceitalea rosinachiae]|uniref:Methylmalonyl Co-A mutase-associated GTPase MeaB n=1 Tax=Croceitalea rosinachiae TaxID=3075596 RepID=A0ABU3A9T0_9FLAO|nr:methylmalonyl Co-A mutase-associated GTPase MeaB [Croceitalea sp. F388]MDT0606934.1 methylmalonyl Co-A mutase-associated GTPase MeaB [Croceitalea sp. F388]